MVDFLIAGHYISPIFNCTDLRVSRSLRSLANYIPPPLTVHFPMMHSVRYQPILYTLYYTLHTEHAYCLSYRFVNNVVITTVIEMVEMVEILDGRLGQCSVERVRYVINNLLHLVIVKYGDTSLVLCISTRLRLVTILSLLVKYLVIFHSDPCNKSYISREISIEHPSVGLASLAQLHISVCLSCPKMRRWNYVRARSKSVLGR